MSEQSEEYDAAYELLLAMGNASERLIVGHVTIAAVNERYALAERARRTARLLSYLAETYELRTATGEMRP